MNNKVIIGVVAAVIVLGAGIWLLTKPKNTVSPYDNSNQTSNQTTQPSPNPSSQQTKSLKDLIGLGTAQKCSYSAANTAGSGEWNIYIASGKMRGDFSTSAGGQTATTHMIADGQNTYVWSDGQTQGIKYSGSAASSINQGINLDAQNYYNCSGWSSDSKVFVTPTNVTFTDMSQYQTPPPTR